MIMFIPIISCHFENVQWIQPLAIGTDPKDRFEHIVIVIEELYQAIMKKMVISKQRICNSEHVWVGAYPIKLCKLNSYMICILEKQLI